MNAEVPGLNLPQGQTPRRKRRWLRALCVVAALLVLVGLLAPYFLNADRFRVSLANLIAAQTGREVMLGKMRVRLLPGVGFAVDNFHMGNPADFAKGEFVSSGEVHGSLAFWPLVLRQEYRITSLELVKPKLALLEDKNGRNNYTFEPSESPPAIHQASFAAIEPNAPAEPSALQVDELTLRDAEVIYGVVDNQGRTTPIVDAAGLNAVLLHLELQPLRVAAWQAAARLAGTRLTLAGWKGPIDFREGDISLRNDALEAAFAVDFGNAAAVEGTVTVPDVEHAVVKFDLKTSDLDVATLVEGLQMVGRHADPAHSHTGNFVPARALVGAGTSSTAQSQGAPASDASQLLVEGHLSAERIHSAPYVAGPATADLRLYPDRLEIWPVTIRLYGGSLQLSARTDRRQTPQRFSTNMEARNLNLGEMVDTSPAAKGTFAGTGELDLQLIGSLDDTWKKSLSGHGEFAVRNGRIRGLNLTGTAQSMAQFLGIGGDTTFTAITGDVNVLNQRVASRDIHINSPRDTADLAGSLGFDGSLDFNGQLIAQIMSPQSLATADTGGTPSNASISTSGNTVGSMLARNGGKLTLPFALRGTLVQPQLGPGHTMPSFPPATQPSPQPNLFHK